MKTQTITLTHLPDILLVVLPEEAKEYHITQDYQGSYLCWDDGTTDFERQQFGDHGQFKFCDNPRNNWRIVSTLADLTEEQADGLVEWHEVLQYYPDYSMYGLWNGDITALESFHSAIRADGWYIGTNPLGTFEDFDKQVFNHSKERLHEWSAAQSRVLCRERCLLLRRVEG